MCFHSSVTKSNKVQVKVQKLFFSFQINSGTMYFLSSAYNLRTKSLVSLQAGSLLTKLFYYKKEKLRIRLGLRKKPKNKLELNLSWKRNLHLAQNGLKFSSPTNTINLTIKVCLLTTTKTKNSQRQSETNLRKNKLSNSRSMRSGWLQKTHQMKRRRKSDIRFIY